MFVKRRGADGCAESCLSPLFARRARSCHGDRSFPLRVVAEVVVAIVRYSGVCCRCVMEDCRKKPTLPVRVVFLQFGQKSFVVDPEDVRRLALVAIARLQDPLNVQAFNFVEWDKPLVISGGPGC